MLKSHFALHKLVMPTNRNGEKVGLMINKTNNNFSNNNELNAITDDLQMTLLKTHKLLKEKTKIAKLIMRNQGMVSKS